MKLNLKRLALSAALLSLLAAGMAVPASAASPFDATDATALAGFSWPWENVNVETIEAGEYAASMTVGTAQQLSPIVLPEKAAQSALICSIDGFSPLNETKHAAM